MTEESLQTLVAIEVKAIVNSRPLAKVVIMLSQV